MFGAKTKLRTSLLSAIVLGASAGAAAAAGSVTILNCSHHPALQVAAYNSNDIARAIASKDACIRGRGKSATITSTRTLAT